MLRRALSKGFTLATRTKRTYLFVIVFASLVVISLITVNQLNQYETDMILNIRGCIVSPGTITKTDFEDSALFKKFSTIQNYARGIYVVYGIVLHLYGTDVGFVWLEPWGGVKYEPEIPWVIDEVKPTKIIEGGSLNYVANNEGVIGRSFNLSFTLGEIANISVSAGVGGSIAFDVKGTKITLKIVGKSIENFNSFANVLDLDASSIIFVTKPFMDRLRSEIFSEIYGDEIDSHVYVLRVIFTAKGDVFSLGTLLALDNKIDKNRDKIEEIITDAGYKPEVITTIRGKELLNSTITTIILFLIVLFIGIIYAFMLVSFRRIDIATLRAIGWGSGHIFTLVLGEFMLTIFTGTFIGIIAATVFFFVNGIPTTILPFIVSLIMALLSLIVGLVILRKRVLRIPPMEAFRTQ